MIKAETITHEAPPAPNWLDHCRALASSGRTMALLVVVAGAAIVGLVFRIENAETSDNLPTANQSQQSENELANPLTVQPLQQLSPGAQQSTGSPQSTTGTPQSNLNNPSTAPIPNPGQGLNAAPYLNKALPTNPLQPITNSTTQLLNNTTQSLNDSVKSATEAAAPIVRQLGL